MLSFLKGIIFYFIINQLLGFLIITISVLQGKDEDTIEPYCMMTSMPLSLLLFNCISKPIYKFIYNMFSYDCYIYYGKNFTEGIILVHPFKKKYIISLKKRKNLIKYNKSGFNSKKSWKKYFNLSELFYGKGYLYYIKDSKSKGD